MSNNQNPATPVAPATATPGVAAAGASAPSSTTPAPAAAGAQGNSPEGSVTIPLKEYRNLQRNAARAASFDRRVQIRTARPTTTSGEGDGSGDPEVAQQIADAERRAQDAERRAMQSDVRARTRDILDKEEFKAIPKSTRELILENPHMLTTADNLEEALLDIEDYVREKVLIDMPAAPSVTTPPAEPKTETPPVVSGGSPAPAGHSNLEDISKLHGPQRSQAAIRNLIKTKGAKTV